MKKTVVFTALLLLLTGMCLADPLVYFAGGTGPQSMQSPNSVTLPTYVPTPVWHFTPETVTFTANGSGSCSPGSCSGVSTNVWETFSTDAYAMYLMDAPNQVTTTATYYLNGSIVGVTNQVGGPIWHERAPGFLFNEVELSWTAPASYKFTFQSFDAAVPEPSSFILLGSGLLTGVTFVRRRLLA